MTDPILSGENYHRCGPKFNFATCSLKPADWTVKQPHNGPCCSPNNYCGETAAHCDRGVDFRELFSTDTFQVKRGTFIPSLIPSRLIPVLSGMRGAIGGEVLVFDNLSAAQSACLKSAKCGGVTKTKAAHFELRSGSLLKPSPTGEISWLKIQNSESKS